MKRVPKFCNSFGVRYRNFCIVLFTSAKCAALFGYRNLNFIKFYLSWESHFGLFGFISFCFCFPCFLAAASTGASGTSLEISVRVVSLSVLGSPLPCSSSPAAKSKVLIKFRALLERILLIYTYYVYIYIWFLVAKKQSHGYRYGALVIGFMVSASHSSGSN